ncbi:hypothetical protein MOMOMM108M1_14070 [Morganella morganii]
MVLAIRCHRQNMKTSIINGSEVSKLSVAIQLVAAAAGLVKPSLVGMKSRVGAVLGYLIIFIIFLVPALILMPD